MGPEFTYWEKAKALTEPGKFLMICGNEISPVAKDDANTATGHIGCIPKQLENFDTLTPFIDRPKGTITGGNVLQQAIDRGCFTIVNHPYSLAKWIEYDWTNMNYDAIEIWNGTIGYDLMDQYARNAWICDLLDGKNTVAIGASDCHRVNTTAPGEGLDPSLGYPATAVFAQSLDWNNIIENLQLGNTYIFEGNSQLLINTYDKEGKNNNTKFDIIRLRGKVDERLENPLLKLMHTTQCDDPRPENDPAKLTETILIEKQISPGESFDIRIDTASVAGVYSATLFGEGVHFGALSRAVVVSK